MARRKNTLTLYAEYLPLRALLAFLGWLPLAGSKLFCRRLIHGILFFFGRRRRLVDLQMAFCFPAMSPQKRQEVAGHAFDTLGDGLATFAKIAQWGPEEMKKQVDILGFEHLDEALKKGKGAITFTAHYGCWELMATYVTRFYPKVAMVVRPLDNPKLDALVKSVRESSGGSVIDSKRVFTEGTALLRGNGILGTLVDQNFHKGGVFVDFFGRPAATNTLTAILARRTGCILLPMHNIWVGDRIRIICEPPLALSRNPNSKEAIWEDTQAMARIVERWVREDPASWLWLHNRWKRQPTPEEAAQYRFPRIEVSS